MTINLGQFGGVFWHDPEKGEQEVVNPSNTKPVQGMLFHPLTGTGVPGDPLQTTVGRELDVRNAFGFSFPDIEKSGLPRNLLGSQGENPTLETMDNRRRSSSGSYNPDTHTIALRPEGHILKNGGEPAIHELGHARDRSRLREISSHTGYIPEAEGVADAFQDRFSAENIMKPSGHLDPLINPDRSSEIMKEPIDKVNGMWRISGYGGNSMVWRDKVEQATYAISRLLGAMRPSGLQARRPTPYRRSGIGSAYLLSNAQLTKSQQAQNDIGKALGSHKPGWFHYVSRGDTTTARTVDIGRLYKHNPHVKKLLDESGLSDLGEFATHVHTAHLENARENKYKQREYARREGKKVDSAPELHQDILEEYRTGKRQGGQEIPKETLRTFRQPSLFEHDPEAMEIIDPKPTRTVDITYSGDTSRWMKENKVKKPKKREKSQWEILKEEHNQKQEKSPFFFNFD